MKYFQMIILAGSLTLAASAYADDDDVPGVSFDSPRNGATVFQRFKVKMEVEGMRIHKAGDPVTGTGHFHIIVDGVCVKKGEAVVKDATHIHFGKGQEKAELKLTPGEHTLSLQFADGHHVSYGHEWCKTIHVNVK